MARNTRQAGEGAAPTRTPARSRPTPTIPAPWWRASLLIGLAILAAGIVPVALAGEVAGAWHVALPGAPRFALFSPASTATPPDLALPREAWISTSTAVRATAGGAPIAMMQPGFPVTLTAHQTRGGVSWSLINWSGPTAASGGEGWVPDSAIVSYGGHSRPIGDIGALAPSLGKALAPYLSQLDLALYFPDGGQLYLENANQPFTLGESAQAVLFVADAAQHALSTGTAAPDPGAVFARLGGAAGAAKQLTALGVNGIAFPSAQWQDAQAAAISMLELYSGLDDGTLLTPSDTKAVLAALRIANVPAIAALFAPAIPTPASFIQSGSWQAAGVWTAQAGGMFIPTHGPRFILVVALRDQREQSTAQQTLEHILRQIAGVATAGDA